MAQLRNGERPVRTRSLRREPVDDRGGCGEPGQIVVAEFRMGREQRTEELGVPFNDAGRMRADTSAESIWGTAEYRCRPHSAPHSWRGVGGARILKDLDPLTRDVTGYHFKYWRSLDRPVYLDNRAHPQG